MDAMFILYNKNRKGKQILDIVTGSHLDLKKAIQNLEYDCYLDIVFQGFFLQELNIKTAPKKDTV